jgi:alkaline phosphatase D
MSDAVRFHDRTIAAMSRRQLLNIAWKLGAAAIAQPLVAAGAWAQPIFRTYPFTLGVASGDPWPDSVVLWTRLAPEPLDGGGMPMINIEVAWEVAADRAFATIVQKGTAIARPELGHSVHAEPKGLQPGREYFYRFRAGGEISPVGRTKTAPAAGAAVDRLRFAVCGCNHYESGYFTAFKRIATEQFDFVYHSGDYIYEGRADGGRNPLVVRQHHGSEIYTLVDYRNRYAQYKMDPDLKAAHASAPFVVTWDDHEVDNDYAGGIDENDTPAEVFMLRRAAAYQAYYEAMPLRPSQLPAGPNMRLYRRLTFGSLLDLTVLDTRQYRSDQVCGTTATGCAAAGDPSRTILGAAQEQWLFDQLGQSRAVWTTIGQQVPTFERDMLASNPKGQFSMDKWDGYTESRRRLYARLRETRASNPIVLSGDVHVHYGAELKADYRDPSSPTVGVEFTNTSATSGGDGSDVAGNWAAIQPDNPHIKYHSARRGYIACTATPSQMRAEFKVFERVTVPDAPEKTGGALVVEAGRPGASSA